jgi:putative hemolysin
MPILYLVGAGAGFAILLYLSAVFSGSETAFFSLSRLDIGEMEKHDRVRSLLDHPDHLLITILIGNTMVNVAAASLGAVVTLHFARSLGYSEAVSIALEVGVITLVILVMSEIAPKMYAIERNIKFARRSAPVLSAVGSVLAPIISVLHGMAARLSGGETGADRPFVTAEELRTIVAISEHDGTLDEEERDMIDSVMEFGATVVRELMVPRVDVEGLEETMTVSEAIALVREVGYSRLPVYREDLDHIVGVLYAKDLLRIDPQTGGGQSVSGLVREAYFTPETKNAGELLRELQRRRTHIAIVVDEYGGTAGVITLEDLIEEIVGEIRDEHDEEKPLLQVLDMKTLIADGSIRLEELAEELAVAGLSGEGIETLAGYLLEAFGRIPSEGEKLERDGLEFTVESVEEQRITSVRIVKGQLPSDEEEEK